MVGENFEWHVDADPRMLPDSPFVTRYASQCCMHVLFADACAVLCSWGRYPNRQPGKPLFVSLLIYLNSHVSERPCRIVAR